MGDVTSLKQARKARDRAARQRQAEANRGKFGRSKAERDADRLERQRATKLHDAHKTDRDDDR